MATVGSVTEQYALPKVTANQTKVLGQDEFLKLIISQLQNQDPTAPMENTEMVAQMAQFTTMENINNMNTSTQQSQAYNMIGKGVMGFTVNAETGIKSEIMGVVDSAGVTSGVSYVMVGDIKVNLKDVQQVYDQNALTGMSEAVIAATNMVGKYARANLGTAVNPEYLEGAVSRWQLIDGIVSITINDQDVILGQIVTVADNMQGLGEAPPAVAAPEAPAPPAETENDNEE